MKRIVFAVGAIVALAVSSATPQANSKALAWKLDRMIVKGAALPKLNGVAIDSLRLIASKDGKLAVAPFQIDEVDAKGMIILAPPGGKAPPDVDNGKFDKNDELVFQASDAGPRGTVEGGNLYQEIELKNPLDGSTAYVYLVEFKTSPPPLSNVDYVAYKKNGDREEVVTSQYTQGFVKQHVFMDDLAISTAAGGNGKNLLDRLKMRTELIALGQSVKIAKCEDDFRSTVTGIKDGPIRVIRRNDTRMALVMGVRSPAVIVDAMFNRNSWEVPSMMSLPFRMDMVANDVVYRQGVDLNSTGSGMKYYNNFNKKGVTFDGRMSPEETEIAKSATTHKWALIAGKPGAFVYTAQWTGGEGIRVLAYYADDVSKKDPPEGDAGLMMYGFRFENLLSIKGSVFAFNLINYVVPGFDGDVDAVAGLAEKPIQVSVK